VLVPQLYSSCRSIAFRAAAMVFVPRRCALCCGNALLAATMFFVPRHCTTCRGIVLRAATSFFVPRQENEVPWHCMPSFFLSCQETTRCSVARRSLPSFLRASARNNSLLCSAACCVVPWCNSLCRGQVRCAAVVFFCATARNDAPQHLMPSFFVLQQETTRCCIPQHCASCRGMVHCTVALFAVPRHGAWPCYHKDWGEGQSTCVALATTAALWRLVWPC